MPGDDRGLSDRRRDEGRNRAADRQSRSMAVNMGDIARLANVSKPTVSRVLNGSPLVNAETRERVLEVAREHGYAVNRNAQKLRQLRTDTIAVMLDFGSHRARAHRRSLHLRTARGRVRGAVGAQPGLAALAAGANRRQELPRSAALARRRRLHLPGSGQSRADAARSRAQPRRRSSSGARSIPPTAIARSAATTGSAASSRANCS